MSGHRCSPGCDYLSPAAHVMAFGERAPAVPVGVQPEPAEYVCVHGKRVTDHYCGDMAENDVAPAAAVPVVHPEPGDRAMKDQPLGDDEIYPEHICDVAEGEDFCGVCGCAGLLASIRAAAVPPANHRLAATVSDEPGVLMRRRQPCNDYRADWRGAHEPHTWERMSGQLRQCPGRSFTREQRWDQALSEWAVFTASDGRLSTGAASEDEVRAECIALADAEVAAAVAAVRADLADKIEALVEDITIDMDTHDRVRSFNFNSGLLKAAALIRGES